MLGNIIRDHDPASGSFAGGATAAQLVAIPRW